MTACNTDGSFCCGKMNPQLCCASNNKMFLPTNVTQTSISTNLQNSTVSSSSPNSTSGAPTSHPSEPLKKQAKIGIGVGVSVFVVAMAIMLVFVARVIRRRKKRHDVAGSTSSASTDRNKGDVRGNAVEIKGTAIYEKYGSELHEVDQNVPQPRELGGDPRSAVELE
jgi:hypothetical protein